MKLIDKIIAAKEYFMEGVWRETSNSFKVHLVKTLNLAYTSFFNRDLQSRSMALTYSTVLAIVPALALLVAIARGFNLQNLIIDELHLMLPSQKEALDTGMSFVDSYLNQASQGVFVGIGIIFLLWTLVSLLSGVEDVFNRLWDVKRTRSIYQKLSDYIAICLIVPVLMLCSAGISIFMSTMIHNGPDLMIFTPLADIMLDALPFILAWLAFSVSYYLIPNTKVKFKYACIAGGFAAIGFYILQTLFVNGQIYVSKYNAIYGSFAFLPLLLIWLQLTWLIILSGCVLSNAMQNVFSFNYLGDVSKISRNYMQLFIIATMTIIVNRFIEHKEPFTRTQLATAYNLPVSLLTRVIEMLHDAKLVYFVMEENNEIGIAPSIDCDTFTVGDLFTTLNRKGEHDFIPWFDEIFEVMIKRLKGIDPTLPQGYDILLRDLPIPTPEQVKEIILKSESDIKEK